MGLLYDSKNEDIQATAYFRVGEVSTVDPSNATATVNFPDEDNVVSYALPVVSRNTLNNKDYWLPDVGESVLCIFQSSDCSKGYVLGSVYSNGVATKVNSQDIRRTDFAADANDSTDHYVEHDRKSHKYTIKIGDSTITVETDSITVNTSKTVNIQGNTEVNVTGNSAINLTTGTLNMNVGGTSMTLAGSSATIQTTDLKFIGSMDVTGDMSVSGKLNTTGDITSSGAVHGTNI